MKSSTWFGLLCAGILLGLTGCAAIEFSRAPIVPEPRVEPSAEKTDHPSPPPLPAAVEKKEPTPPPQPEAAKAPLNLTVEAAIAMALENNQALQVQEINPALAKTSVARERAVFDPTLAGAFTRTRNKTERELALQEPIQVTDANGNVNTIGTTTRGVTTDTTTLTSTTNAGISEFLPTGTSVSLDVTPSSTSQNQDSSNLHLAYVYAGLDFGFLRLGHVE